MIFFFFQAEDGIRDHCVTGVQTCALPICKEQKTFTSLSLKKHFAEYGHHNKGKRGNLSPQYGIGGKIIKMKSEYGEEVSFPSINSARLKFRVRFSTISSNVNTNLPVLIKGVK